MCIYIEATYSCSDKSPYMYSTCKESFSSNNGLSPLCHIDDVLHMIFWCIKGPCIDCYWMFRERAYNVCPP